MNLHSKRTIISIPPDLEDNIEFSKAKKTNATQSQIVKI